MSRNSSPDEVPVDSEQYVVQSKPEFLTAERRPGQHSTLPLAPSPRSIQTRLTNPRHVEPIQEGLYRPINLRRLALSFELQNSLRDRSDDGVVPPLDIRQELRESFVVVVHLWWPLDPVPWICVVPTSIESQLSYVKAHHSHSPPKRTGVVEGPSSFHLNYFARCCPSVSCVPVAKDSGSMRARDRNRESPSRKRHKAQEVVPVSEI